MGNPEKGEVSLVIKGKTYTLVLKTAGLIAVQTRLSPAGGPKRKLLEVVAELERAVKSESLEHIVIFMWAALQKYHPGLTEMDAMNLIDDIGGIPGLESAFGELAESMAPDEDDVKELATTARSANPPKARASKK